MQRVIYWLNSAWKNLPIVHWEISNAVRLALSQNPESRINVNTPQKSDKLTADAVSVGAIGLNYFKSMMGAKTPSPQLELKKLCHHLPKLTNILRVWTSAAIVVNRQGHHKRSVSTGVRDLVPAILFISESVQSTL